MSTRSKGSRGGAGRGGPDRPVARPLGPRRLYARLLGEYGPLDWWPSDGPFEVMVGAVLTQRTAWANVERAIEALRAAGASTPSALLAIDRERLEALVRPSGTYRQKAERLVRLCDAIEHAGGLGPMLVAPTEELRRELLAVSGIGPETADSILLYAAGRPVFVVDAYTRRLLGRLGRDAVAAAPYDEVAAWFVRALPRDAALLGNFHAVIVEHCKRRCRVRPVCEGCPLRPDCNTGVARTVHL